MEKLKILKIFRFLFEGAKGGDKICPKRYYRGLFFFTIAQIFLLFFIPYLSPFSEESHLLGFVGFSFSDFLIRKILGLSAFSLPIVFIFLGIHDLYRKSNISVTIQQIVASIFMLFTLNIALLNTKLIFTSLAGLFPQFFHAIIVHYWGNNHKLPSSTSITIEVFICLFAFLFLFLSFRWHLQWKIFTKFFNKIYNFSKQFFIALFSGNKKGVFVFNFSFLSRAADKTVEKTAENADRTVEKTAENADRTVEKTAENADKTVEKTAENADKTVENFSQKYSQNPLQNRMMDANIPQQTIYVASNIQKEIDLSNTKFFLKEGVECSSDIFSLASENRNQKNIPDLVSGLAKNFGNDHLSTSRSLEKSENCNEKIFQESQNRSLSGFSVPISCTSAVEKKNINDFSLGKENRVGGFHEQINLPNTPNNTSNNTPRCSENHELPRVINFFGDHQKENCIASAQCLTISRSFIDGMGEKREEIEKTEKRLVKTFAEFGITTSVKEAVTGPVITQYQITLEPGVRIQRVSALADNLALSLAASSLRIIAPIPGKSLIGIEIPNRNRYMVSLSQIMSAEHFSRPNFFLPIALGASIVGEPVVTDLSKTPHLLIAGATGSGKSVCVNGIIASLLLQRSPDFVRFLMIDPKMVELNIYNGIPHLLHPVITAAKEASAALRWVLAEMQARYNLLEKNGMRNIVSYNEIARAPDSGMPSMPYIVVVIDEMADLMMSARRDVEETICRLAAMSRAVGIHLILATQRPSVDVITGLIKSNFPSRIAFKVSSKVDSRTIIDGSGAEKLLGKGDMLFQTATSSSLQRLQGAFLSDTELWRIVDDLKKKSNGRVEWIKEMLSSENKDDASSEKDTEQDELFREGLCIAVREGKISASFLQRRLKIGYNRAARMVELMEKKGMVSSAEGAKPREVLISTVPS